MAGYFHERLNTGTKDPLKAKAIVFAQGDAHAALVFCDLVSVPASVTVRARQQAAARTGIPAGHIGIAATHSHTGPLFHGPMEKILRERAVAEKGKDPHEFGYAAALTNRLVEALVKACEAVAPASLEVGRAEEKGVSFHRRFHMKDGTVRTNPGQGNPDVVRPAGPIDPEVGILLARGRAGPVASLTVFACHLDTVGGTDYSADYPFFLERDLRILLGDSFVSLFGAGPCGNINHVDVTVKERLRTETIGATLARRVAGQLPRLAAVEPALAVRNARVDVPLQVPTPRQVEEANAARPKVGSRELPFLKQVETVRVLHLLDLPNPYPLEVQAFRLGRDVAVVTLPGEVFVELGLAIKRASPFRHTFVVELANDNPAYVPTREAFPQGAYEVENSRVAPGGGEKLVETAVALLEELKP
jgi:hypothetical protein